MREEVGEGEEAEEWVAEDMDRGDLSLSTDGE